MTGLLRRMAIRSQLGDQIGRVGHLLWADENDDDPQFGDSNDYKNWQKIVCLKLIMCRPQLSELSFRCFLWLSFEKLL